jgi:hypothetical protein
MLIVSIQDNQVKDEGLIIHPGAQMSDKEYSKRLSSPWKKCQLTISFTHHLCLGCSPAVLFDSTPVAFAWLGNSKLQLHSILYAIAGYACVAAKLSGRG